MDPAHILLFSHDRVLSITAVTGDDSTMRQQIVESVQTYGSTSRSRGDCHVLQLTEAVGLLTSPSESSVLQSGSTDPSDGSDSDRRTGDDRTRLMQLAELRSRFANRTIVLCKPVRNTRLNSSSSAKEKEQVEMSHGYTVNKSSDI